MPATTIRSDVILMYAEALNQNGKTAEACKYLNMTRRRGFGYQTTEISPVDQQTTDRTQFSLLVEQERRVELAFENHRWFDLVRTGRAKDVMTAEQKFDGYSDFTWSDDALAYPIPMTVMQSNPGKIIQNKGYTQL